MQVNNPILNNAHAVLRGGKMREPVLTNHFWPGTGLPRNGSSLLLAEECGIPVWTAAEKLTSDRLRLMRDGRLEVGFKRQGSATGILTWRFGSGARELYFGSFFRADNSPLGAPANFAGWSKPDAKGVFGVFLGSGDFFFIAMPTKIVSAIEDLVEQNRQLLDFNAKHRHDMDVLDIFQNRTSASSIFARSSIRAVAR